MRRTFTVCLLLVSGFIQAQKNIGIQFQHGLAWTQVKEKARKENKYIFIDVFTTWCSPCIQMAQQIFPQKKVGDFFNQNFINVAVQFDVTKKDNQEVKNWYKEVKVLKNKYQVNLYPTYLFFNPQGELVHRMNGATFNAGEFIAKAKNALNPATQLLTLKEQFRKGSKEPNFLLTLTKVAQQANDFKFVPIAANAYLSTQDNLLTNENLKLIIPATTKSTDVGFKILRTHSAEVDAVEGKGKSAEKVITVVYDEAVLPHIATGAGKNDFGGGMAMYYGEIRKSVNWDSIKVILETKYPDLSDAVLAAAKPFYYQWLGDWTKLSASVNDYLSSPYADNLSNDHLNAYAMNIFHSSDNQQNIESALDWSKKTLSGENQKNISYLYTYSNLLYKLGKKEQAVSTMQEAITLAGEKDGELTKLMAKMKSGEKTW